MAEQSKRTGNHKSLRINFPIKRILTIYIPFLCLDIKCLFMKEMIMNIADVKIRTNGEAASNSS